MVFVLDLKADNSMLIVQPSVKDHESISAKRYIDRTIDSYLIEDLNFTEEYSVLYQKDVLVKKIKCHEGITLIYALEYGLVVIICRDYLVDFNDLDLHIGYDAMDVSSPEAYMLFLQKVLIKYQYAFNGTEDEIRREFKLPKRRVHRISEWFKEKFK
jgi:hypothetical protein